MRKLVLASVLVALVAFLIYQPLPKDWQQPWKTRTILASLPLLDLLAEGAGLLGYNSLQFSRNAMDILAPYTRRAGNLTEVITEEIIIEDVLVRVYRAAGNEGKRNLPGLIYYHGGGWTVGSIDTHDLLVRRIVRDLDLVALSVSYRLAPEYPYPIPYEDCLKVTKYVLKNAQKFGMDKSRIAIGGDSAGGNMAAGISLKLRDDKFPIRPKIQVLFYPALQFLDLNTPSFQANKKGPLIVIDAVGFYFGNYFLGHDNNRQDLIDNQHVPKYALEYIHKTWMQLEDLPDDEMRKTHKPVSLPEKSKLWEKLEEPLTNPYISPLLADDLTDLPYAYLNVCENDVLRDDGLWYAKRLGQNVHLDYQHCFHGWNLFTEDLESANLLMITFIEFMKKHL